MREEDGKHCIVSVTHDDYAVCAAVAMWCDAAELPTFVHRASQGDPSHVTRIDLLFGKKELLYLMDEFGSVIRC